MAMCVCVYLVGWVHVREREVTSVSRERAKCVGVCRCVCVCRCVVWCVCVLCGGYPPRPALPWFLPVPNGPSPRPVYTSPARPATNNPAYSFQVGNLFISLVHLSNSVMCSY
jgi:hypothetical protein